MRGVLLAFLLLSALILLPSTEASLFSTTPETCFLDLDCDLTLHTSASVPDPYDYLKIELEPRSFSNPDMRWTYNLGSYSCTNFLSPGNCYNLFSYGNSFSISIPRNTYNTEGFHKISFYANSTQDSFPFNRVLDKSGYSYVMFSKFDTEITADILSPGGSVLFSELQACDNGALTGNTCRVTFTLNRPVDVSNARIRMYHNNIAGSRTFTSGRIYQDPNDKFKLVLELLPSDFTGLNIDFDIRFRVEDMGVSPSTLTDEKPLDLYREDPPLAIKDTGTLYPQTCDIKYPCLVYAKTNRNVEDLALHPDFKVSYYGTSTYTWTKAKCTSGTNTVKKFCLDASWGELSFIIAPNVVTTPGVKTFEVYNPVAFNNNPETVYFNIEFIDENKPEYCDVDINLNPVNNNPTVLQTCGHNNNNPSSPIYNCAEGSMITSIVDFKDFDSSYDNCNLVDEITVYLSNAESLSLTDYDNNDLCIYAVNYQVDDVGAYSNFGSEKRGLLAGELERLELPGLKDCKDDNVILTPLCDASKISGLIEGSGREVELAELYNFLIDFNRMSGQANNQCQDLQPTVILTSDGLSTASVSSRDPFKLFAVNIENLFNTIPLEFDYTASVPIGDPDYVTPTGTFNSYSNAVINNYEQCECEYSYDPSLPYTQALGFPDGCSVYDAIISPDVNVPSCEAMLTDYYGPAAANVAYTGEIGCTVTSPFLRQNSFEKIYSAGFLDLIDYTGVTPGGATWGNSVWYAYDGSSTVAPGTALRWDNPNNDQYFGASVNNYLTGYGKVSTCRMEYNFTLAYTQIDADFIELNPRDSSNVDPLPSFGGRIFVYYYTSDDLSDWELIPESYIVNPDYQWYGYPYALMTGTQVEWDGIVEVEESRLTFTDRDSIRYKVVAYRLDYAQIISDGFNLPNVDLSLEKNYYSTPSVGYAYYPSEIVLPPSQCEIGVVYVNAYSGVGGCNANGDTVCDEGENVEITTTYSGVLRHSDCDLIDSISVDLSNANCELSATGDMPPVSVSGLTPGSVRDFSNFLYSLPSIPEACYFQTVNDDAVTVLDIYGRNINVNSLFGEFTLGAPQTLKDQVEVKLIPGKRLAADTPTCGPGYGPCSGEDFMYLRVEYPQVFGPSFFQWSKNYVTDGLSCTFDYNSYDFWFVSGLSSPWDCNTFGSNYLCTSYRRMPAATPQCSSKTVSLESSKISKISPNIIDLLETTNTDGSFTFESLGCELKSITFDKSDCESGIDNDLCWNNDVITADIVINGSDCGLIDTLEFEDAPNPNSCDLSDFANDFVFNSLTSTGGLFEYSSSASFNVGTIPEICKGRDLSIDSIKGSQSSTGIDYLNNDIGENVSFYAGDCKIPDPDPTLNFFFGDNNDLAISIPGVSKAFTDLGDPFNAGNLLREQYGFLSEELLDVMTSFGFNRNSPKLCQFGDELGCEPDETFYYTLAVEGDCRNIDSIDLDFSFKDPSSFSSTGVDADYCFYDTTITRDRFSEIFYMLDSPSRATTLRFPIAGLHTSCLNKQIWIDSVHFYDGAVLNSSRQFIHDDDSRFSESSFGPYAAPGFISLGSDPGVNVTRFCGEVWDDNPVTGQITKIRDASCNRYEPELNTELTPFNFACPENYCLWHDDARTMPTYDGAPLPPISDTSFWSANKFDCVEPGHNITHTQFGSPVTLTCMGQQTHGDGSNTFDVYPFCPTYGGKGADWVMVNSFLPQLGGYCAPQNDVCDSGIASDLGVVNGPFGTQFPNLICDQNMTDILADTGIDGAADNCLDTRIDRSGGNNDPLAYPKVQVCCPLIDIPVLDENGDSVDYSFYDWQLTKVY